MRAKRVDDNQPAIVEQLRKIPGVSVFCTHTVGNGFTDIIIGYRKRNYIIELKDPSKPPSRRKLTPDEEKFHRDWQGQVNVAETITDILKIINQ